MAKTKNALVSIGILSYKDKAYLKEGIPSLFAQTYDNIEVLVCDNNEDDTKEISKWLKKTFPKVKVLTAGGNVGFGRGHNHLISKSKGEYYLCFNSDMFADKNFVAKLVEEIETDEKIGCVSGKLLKWPNFPKKPSRRDAQIDTTGIVANSNHHFFERGHGEEDKGQYDQASEVWGASGAAPLLRKKALEDIAHSPGEYFDKQFFMYKEDIDLMYRLRWAGWKVRFTPKAEAWHDRTAEDPGGIIANIKKRRSRAGYIKENSFLNHLQFTYKNWSSDFSWTTKIATSFFLLKYFLYLAIFDRKVLKKYKDFKRLKPLLLEKRNTMPRRVSAKEMEKWFL
jgi:GT2 family glycosyltransferase